MVGYYHKFCHNFSTVTEPLTALLRKGETFSWSVTCQEAFNKIKSILCSEPVLMALSFEKPLNLFMDVSDIDMGAVLLQVDVNRTDHPVCYHSRKFNSHWHNYLTMKKETLALVASLQHVEVYLSLSTSPQVYTDHNSLTYIQHNYEES